jgi:ABC-2 type transport system permease protein
MKELVRYAKLYRLFFVQRLKILLEYRASFILGATSTIGGQLAGLLAVFIVMGQIPSLNGWHLEEILLIYGLLLVARSLNHMFADNLWTMGREYIRTGQFDRFLVRPVNPLFHLLADRFCQDGLGYFIIGIVLIVHAFIVIPIPLTAVNVVYTLVAVVSGGLIFGALQLITACASFWIVDSAPVIRLIYDNHEFAKYPVTIYPSMIRAFLTILLPYAFASFYPASYLLGRDASLIVWLGPLVALILCVFGYRLWVFGLRHYNSTGS